MYVNRRDFHQRENKDPVLQKFFPLRYDAKRVKAGPYTIKALFDGHCFELFADDGLISMSALVFPEKPFERIEAYGMKGTYRVLNK